MEIMDKANNLMFLEIIIYTLKHIYFSIEKDFKKLNKGIHAMLS